MQVTPLDLRQSQFAGSMRGHDKNEVRALLADGADELENALREIDRLRQDVQHAESALTEHRAKAGAAVVIDVRSGEVLALANLPTFNPNNRASVGAVS